MTQLEATPQGDVVCLERQTRNLDLAIFGSCLGASQACFGVTLIIIIGFCFELLWLLSLLGLVSVYENPHFSLFGFCIQAIGPIRAPKATEVSHFMGV